MSEAQPEYRPTPDRLIVGPVTYHYTKIVDAHSNMIIDVRGWGRLQYMKDGAELQDKIGQWVADAINEKLKRDPI